MSGKQGTTPTSNSTDYVHGRKHQVSDRIEADLYKRRGEIKNRKRATQGWETKEEIPGPECDGRRGNRYTTLS